MPRYRNERRPWITGQSTIPSTQSWLSNAEDVGETAYQNELEDWYASNYGVQQPDGFFVGPEMQKAPVGSFDMGPRQVGQPMRRFEPYQQSPKWMDRLGDIVLGYDPREGAEDYDPEYEDSSLAEAALMSFVPGRSILSRGARKVGAGAFAGLVGEDAAAGRQLGALDLMFMGGLAGHGVRAADRARRSFQYGYKMGKARRAAEQARRARALDVPRVRMQNARTGRWDEVNAYPEFVPYEEIGF